MQIFLLNPKSEIPLFKQLYQEIRAAILENRLSAGLRLPSSRELASDLGVSRNTVLNAYEQLLAEGYIQGKVGSGSYVSHLSQSTMPAPLVKAERPLSKSGKLLAETNVSNTANPSAKFSFRPGTPALEIFPFAYWKRLLSESLNFLRAKDFHYSDPAGYVPLRQAIAGYLNRNRGVRCKWEQILIVSGSQQALDLCSRILLEKGETTWIEDPGYKGARAALHASGARIIPVPVDSEGLQWKKISGASPPALIYITPSHQFPVGITMSLQRRLSLLKVAQDQNSWIIEDDYDSEFRYDGRPLAALQGLDRSERVLYIGTFSKVMFAGLRLGYLVVPFSLFPVFLKAKAVLDRHSPILEQAALSLFIQQGRFERHIREMRKLYGKRQKALIQAVNNSAPMLHLNPSPAGMHLVGYLPEGWNDREISATAAEHGIETPALSDYSIRPLRKQGLLLGYSALPPKRIAEGIALLGKVLDERRHSAG
jgi:GntR family transcriptional regulator/MocR family aminotransferase